MNNRYKTELSEEGQIRRQRMLAELQNEVRSIPIRRTKRRVTAVVMMMVLGTLGIWWAMTPSSHDANLNVVNNTTATNTNLDPFAPENVIVGNRNGVVERYLVTTDQLNLREFETISDDELLELLTQAGRPSVLGRIDGKFAVIATEIVQAPISN